MRRFLLSCLLLCAWPLMAQSPVGAFTYDWPAVTTTGPTSYIDLTGPANLGAVFISIRQTVSVSVGAGALTACTFQLEGSDDATNWYSLSGSQSCLTPMMFSVVDRPARLIRINVLTYTGTAPLTFHWTGR